MSSKIKYSLVKKIQDDTFEIDHLHEYILSVQVGSSQFRFCVTDSQRNRCMLIEDYKCAYSLEADEIVEQLDLLFDDHVLLQAGFWKSVKLSIKNLKFSLVPNSLFSDKHTSDFLNLSNNCTEEEEIHYFKHGKNDSVNIFAAEKKLVNWFKNRYSSRPVDVIHHTSTLIEGVLQQYSKADKQRIYVSVSDDILTVVVKKGSELLFCNNFKFKTPNDFIYFVLFVYDGLELNVESIPVVLMGDISRNSEIFNKLYKYIRHIHFGEKPGSLKFSYKFDEIHDHLYFDLYNMHLC